MTPQGFKEIAEYTAQWDVRVTITVDGVLLRMQRRERVVKRIISFVDLCAARYPVLIFQEHVIIMDKELGA